MQVWRFLSGVLILQLGGVADWMIRKGTIEVVMTDDNYVYAKALALRKKNCAIYFVVNIDLRCRCTKNLGNYHCTRKKLFQILVL